MNEQLFEWIIGGLVGIFGAGFTALWILQLRMEARLVAWIKKHVEEDETVHNTAASDIKKQEEMIHAAELRAAQTFATKNDLDKITSHIDQGMRDVNARLDLVLMNMTPGKN